MVGVCVWVFKVHCCIFYLWVVDKNARDLLDCVSSFVLLKDIGIAILKPKTFTIK